MPVWDTEACYQGVFAAREELVMKGENANVLGMERPMQHHDAVTSDSIHIHFLTVSRLFGADSATTPTPTLPS